MIILRNKKKITDFFTILVLLCRFKILHQNRVYEMTIREPMFNNAFIWQRPFLNRP